MSAAIIGVVLLILIGLAVGIYFLLNAKKCEDHETEEECKEPCQWDTYGGKCIDEEATLTQAPAPAPTQVPTPRQDPSGSGASAMGYRKFDNKKLNKNLALAPCSKAKTIDECRESCTYEQQCLAFTYDGKKCCMYSGIDEFSPSDDTDIYLRNAIGYTTGTLGNFGGDEFLTKTASSLEMCGDSCDETQQCKGFSYKQGSCILKGENVSSSPILDGSQYYKRNATNVAGQLNCKSLGATNLGNAQIFIRSASTQEVPNKMIAGKSFWYDDQWKDQGAVELQDYGRTFDANSGTVATIKPVPGRDDDYHITFTYPIDSREGTGTKTIMMYGGNITEDGEVTSFGSWSYWNDPLCRWKFFKKAGTENLYWIVTNWEHRGPCMMLKTTDDGLRGVPMDLTDDEALWNLEQFSGVGS